MGSIPTRVILLACRLVCIAASALPAAVMAQQVADTSFLPTLSAPAFALGQGPRLCIDAAHFNFHTREGRFLPFARLAERDGFRVVDNRARFTAESLAACELLVISNAQPSAEPWSRYPRPTPSAFAAAEIAAVRAWVEQGGRLLLVADHMPLAGAAKALASAFGAEFFDGFAFPDTVTTDLAGFRARMDIPPTLFATDSGTLRDHAITRGRAGRGEAVTQIRSFTGQAFRWDRDGVEPLMLLPADYVSLEPEVAWMFIEQTAVRRTGGWLQGAARHQGKGRLVLLGEAAMLTAQRAGPQGTPMGMNAPGAEQNVQFALNVLRWLVGLL